MYFFKLLISILILYLSYQIYPQTHPNFLRIKSVGILEEVYLGYSESLLDKGLLLDKNSLDSNNWILYGHRFSNTNPLRKYLMDLDKVKVGEMVYLNFKNIKYTFVTEQILTIEPEDLWITSATTLPKLTIITCTPMINPKDRLVVISKLVSVD